VTLHPALPDEEKPHGIHITRCVNQQPADVHIMHGTIDLQYISKLVSAAGT
jgi:hypothetical protein